MDSSQNSRCGHCSLNTHCPNDKVECNGVMHRRYCDLVNPEHPDYNPAYISVLCKEPKPKPMPSFVTQVSTAAIAAVNFAASGFVLVGPEIEKQRKDICMECPLNVNGRCSKCGCLIRLKVKPASESCPEGKWAKVEQAPKEPCGCGGNK
jgi:hypothetical protein